MMKLISKKKQTYKVCPAFDKYLRYFSRGCRLPLEYDDLLRFSDSFSLYDKNGDDTLWVTLNYPYSDQEEIFNGLLKIYSFLRADGEIDHLQHLVVDRIDLCLYGNTKPFRIRILNQLNDNFDYFYIKEADASRLYGLELEHVLSPNRIGFMYFENTLIEEHIYGIPGDMFIEQFLPHCSDSSKVRVSKEFVKFNERSFIHLLGDMHAANFVVDITMDFEENFYRIRAIDFDQQSYEPSKKIYLPQFFSQNAPFVKLASQCLTQQTVSQYQNEERSLIRRRIHSSSYRLARLMEVMSNDTIAPLENVTELRSELADHYNDQNFRGCQSMGQVVAHSLLQLERHSHVVS